MPKNRTPEEIDLMVEAIAFLILQLTDDQRDDELIKLNASDPFLCDAVEAKMAKMRAD
jgi:hypothetical protein